jgi:hypothetical protein
MREGLRVIGEKSNRRLRSAEIVARVRKVKRQPSLFYNIAALRIFPASLFLPRAREQHSQHFRCGPPFLLRVLFLLARASNILSIVIRSDQEGNQTVAFPMRHI